jgi:RimJ/RimL family protein N-acetyltransferase
MKLETNRTYIREFTLADAEAVLAFSSNEQVTRYTGDAGLMTSLEDARQVISNIWLKEYKQYGYGRWAVVDKSNDRVIGFCGLKFLPDVGMPDIGYRFLPEYWGKGLATETAQACIKFCKEQLAVTTFFADVMEENTASVNVIKKLGLTFTKYVQEGGETFMRFEQ